MNIEQALEKVTGLTVQTFIEKAIEGGWKSPRYPKHTPERLRNVSEFWASIETTERTFSEEENKEVPVTFTVPPETILLDPLAWQAVGKVEDWGEFPTMMNFTDALDGGQLYGKKIEKWQYLWHRFHDALAEQI